MADSSTYGTAADYQAAQGLLSQLGLGGFTDTGSLSALLDAAAPYLGGASAVLGLGGLLGGPNLNPLSAIMGAFSGRPTEQATSDVAGGAGAYSDPVIQLLGKGAGNLAAAGIPISSSSGAANSFGPYFDAARMLEDLARWGPGGLTDSKAKNADALTLKNALTELGNPGTGTGTLQALQNTFQAGSQYLTPQNLQLLWNQANPTEQNILKSVIGQLGDSVTGNTITANTGGNTGGGNLGANPQPGYQLPVQSIINLAQLPALMQLFGGSPGGFAAGWSRPF